MFESDQRRIKPSLHLASAVRDFLKDNKCSFEPKADPGDLCLNEVIRQLCWIRAEKRLDLRRSLSRLICQADTERRYRTRPCEDGMKDRWGRYCSLVRVDCHLWVIENLITTGYYIAFEYEQAVAFFEMEEKQMAETMSDFWGTQFVGW